MNDHQPDHEHEPRPVAPPTTREQRSVRPPGPRSSPAAPRSDPPLWSSEEPAPKPFEPPKKLGIKPEFTARARASRAALRAEAPDASAAERIIHDLVGNQMAVALALMDAQAELVTRLALCIETPSLALVVSRVLLQVTNLSNSVGSRIEKSLTVADSLRAHRRLWKPGKHGTTQ